MVVFRASKVIDKNPFFLGARAKVPADDQCIRALAYYFTIVVHAEHPAPDKSIDYEQVVTFAPSYRRNSFIPEQSAVRRIMGGDELSALHDYNIIDSKQRFR